MDELSPVRGSERAGVPPLILTLALDAVAFARLDGLRRRHFPRALNRIPAHLTLFHALPGEEEDAVLANLREAAARPPLAMEADGLRFLGRGVAVTLRAPALKRLRGDLARRWEPWLTPQDRQPISPHVTVQNKVAPQVARALHEALEAEFEPFPVTGEGFLLWRYLGGPWEKVAEVPFAAPGEGPPGP